MTDKTEAQPEALRLVEFFESLTKSSHRWWDGVPVHEKAAMVLRAQATEIQQLKAQLSARQAAPVMVVTEAMHEAAVKVLHRANGVDGLPQRMLDAMLTAAPRPPEREPLTDEQIFAIAKDVFGGKAHELIHETSPDYAKDCDMEPGARWTCSEVRPEQTLALSRALEHAHGIGATNDNP